LQYGAERLPHSALPEIFFRKSVKRFWQYHPLAYCIVENENNPKKAAARIKETFADFKTAIKIVDMLPVKSDQRNIPRWNAEMVTGERYMKRISSGRPADGHRLNIKENLEAIIPESGGYAPGEPVDMRIEKQCFHDI
jgi:hypothetical protein